MTHLTGVAGPTISPRYTLPTLSTPLGDWPREWLERIEPKIARTSIEDGNHWFWTGYFKGRYPSIAWKDTNAKSGMRTRSVTKIIALLWWRIPPDLSERHWVCVPICGFQNCVNPRHLVVKRREVEQ